MILFKLINIWRAIILMIFKIKISVPLAKINVTRNDDDLFKSEIDNRTYSLKTIDLNGHVISFTR